MQQPLRVIKIIAYIHLTLLSLAINAAKFTPVVKATSAINNFDTSEDQSWVEFDERLKQMKEIGVNSVATEIWWGVVEKSDNNFDWSYYEKVSNLIIKNGLKWIPTISFHSCEPSLELNCNISVPSWIWTKYNNEELALDSNSLKYLDELGNASVSSVSVWATQIVLNDYKDFIISFADRFSSIANSIEEINLGIGPNGEVRYPKSFSNDDQKIVLNQAHSKLAKQSFINFVKNKYKTIENISSVWGNELTTFENIQTPLSKVLLENNTLLSQYSKDFYEWYNQSLIDHVQLVVTTAVRELNKDDSPFKNKPIGTKVPNVPEISKQHRLAELNAGLIRIDTNYLDANPALSYTDLIKSFTTIKELTKYQSFNFTYTGLEKSDQNQDGNLTSRAKTLVIAISELSKSNNIPIKGENTSASTLGSNSSWDNMWSAIQNAQYSGLTINRLEKISSNPLALDFLNWIIDNTKNETID
ncbi:family 14 glycosylhydrolase [Halobacteriovorax sp. HLS]|uniref:family 14 glycosylhydrolase n=1 Tax=Halobacteriovorax sp. HLS TaxID=2234000 RepID=UPI000FD72602|nr:family 14 glycosylhydrolase [Halobacteriovorax sp. HLS]